MSRLIFEGDTTDRFGKLFPKPFIQEIRVYDDLIQADVMLFFEVPLDDGSSVALISKIDTNLRVFGAFLERDQFNRTINPDSQNDFYRNSFFTLNFNQNDFVRSNPLTNVEYHYNSEGKRFAKCLVTFDYSNIAPFLGIARDRYFATFTSFTTPSAELLRSHRDEHILLNAEDYQNTLLRNQTSDLVYEKIFNADNTLNTGKQNTYQQLDGNYYGKIPLQSLGKIYKQADRMTHQNILQIINPIISPFVGSNEEANKVSITLSQYANDPMLLTQLEKDIKSFTNKSSATTTGQLYGELVRAVADIDNLLQNEPTLDKRLETNNKIVDLRLEKSPDILRGLRTSNIDLNSLQDFSNFIYNPLSSRSLYIKKYNSNEPPERYAVRNDMHVFYDYEKSLNYQSEISKFLNPYNILEIFGKNCLNSYFEVEEVRAKFMKQAEVVEIYGDGKTLSAYSTTDTDNNFYRTLDETLAVIGDQYLYSHVAERYFDTVDGLGDYKLKYYNIVELSSISQATQQQSQKLTIKVIDKTMQFYREHIAQMVIETFEQLGEYLEFSNQFCSYNNLDKRFNDFFVNSINDEFSEPYPWNHAPLVYYSMVSLLQSSYQTVGGWSASSRKRDGTSIDLIGVQKNAAQHMLKISPISGDLENLNLFYEQFKTLKNYFIKGDGLDGDNEIYSDEEEGNKLLKDETSLEIFRLFSNLDTPIIDSFQSSRTYRSRLSIEADADQSEPHLYSYAEGLWVALSDNEMAYVITSLGDAATDPQFSDWTTLFDDSYDMSNITQAYDADPGEENKLKKAFLNIVPAYLDAKNTYDYDGSFYSFAFGANLDGFTEEGS